jgi:ankyrin repeat protein
MRFVRAAMLVSSLLGCAAGNLAAQDPQSRLWDAAMAGDTAAIRQALSAGAKIDSLDVRRSANGRYALNWAVLNNKVDAVKLLLELKAPLEAQNRTGFTALLHAAEAGSLDAARILLAAGANPDHANHEGVTATIIATARGHEALAQLIDAAPRKKKQ